MKQHHPTLPELLDLIERFFDCSLSDSEELRLRRLIAETSLSHPSIDQAKAIMGVRAPSGVKAVKSSGSSVSPAATSNHKHIALRPALSIAAAIAALLTLGIYLFVTPAVGNIEENKCIAYAHGQRITDEEDVMRLLKDDLREFDKAVEASDRSFTDELVDIAPVIESYESPLNM